MTLALAGKTRRRRTFLVTGAIIAIFVSMVGGASLNGGKSANATGDDSPAECETGYKDDSGSNPVTTITAPAGQVITAVCIKSGEAAFGDSKHSGLITTDGTVGDAPGYTVAGLGTGTVTVTRNGESKDISHVDYVLGEAPATGTVVVMKVITNDSADTTTPFSGTLQSGGVDVTGSPFSDLKQGVAGAKTFSGLAMGTYDLAETPVNAAFTLLGYKEGGGTAAAPTCPTPTSYDSSLGATLASDGDVKVLCVYNEKRGAIHIFKVVTNVVDSPWYFYATIDGGVALPFTESGGSYWNPVTFGAHVVTEAPAAGYTTLGWATITAGTTCPAAMPTIVGGNVLSFGTDNTAEVTVAVTDINATYICFYNQMAEPETGSLVIHKQKTASSPADATTVFAGTIDGNSTLPWNLTGIGGASATITLPTGSHTVQEVAANGWTRADGGLLALATGGTTSPICSTNPADYTLAAATITNGQTTHVCVLNQKPPEVVLRTLFVNKVIVSPVPDNTAVFGGLVDSAVSLPWQTTNSVAVQVANNLNPGVYHVHEDPKAGYVNLGFAVVYAGAVCPSGPTAVTEGLADLSGPNTVATVCVYNQPRVNVIVNKVEVSDGVSSAGQGWKVMLTGCDVIADVKTTSGTEGTAEWLNLPPCTAYTVSEDTGSKPGLGFTPSSPPSVTIGALGAGQTYTVTFTNSRTTFIPFETPTPVPPVETPVPPVETPVPPVETPVVPPTPPLDAVAGEKTPEVLATPIAPVAGTGARAEGATSNGLLLMVGAVILGAGVTLVVAGRRMNTN